MTAPSVEHLAGPEVVDRETRTSVVEVRPASPVVVALSGVGSLPVSPSRRTGGGVPPLVLRGLREAAGLRLVDVARAVHVSRTTISLWEAGSRRPARQHWPALSALLGLGAEHLAALLDRHPPARLDARPLRGLAHARRQRGLTQRALAGQIGVAASTLAMWETRCVPVAPDLESRLARVLQLEKGQLAGAAPKARVQPDARPLRGLRRTAGLSQREAAAYLGVAPGTLARYEAGERVPTMAVVRRMAVTYHRPAGEVASLCHIDLTPLPAAWPWGTGDVPAGIHAARVAAGLTAVDLGRAVRRSAQVVRAWETDCRRPDSDACRRLELALHLLTGTIPPR